MNVRERINRILIQKPQDFSHVSFNIVILVQEEDSWCIVNFGEKFYIRNLNVFERLLDWFPANFVKYNLSSRLQVLVMLGDLNLYSRSRNQQKSKTDCSRNSKTRVSIALKFGTTVLYIYISYVWVCGCTASKSVFKPTKSWWQDCGELQGGYCKPHRDGNVIPHVHHHLWQNWN